MAGKPCIRGMRVTVGLIAFAARLAQRHDPRRELMRLLIDMNLIPRWAPFLRNAGHEAVHWSSVGSISVKDGHICDYAPPTWLCNF